MPNQLNRKNSPAISCAQVFQNIFHWPFCSLCAAPCSAQSYEFLGNSIKRHANDALALMAFSVVPDLTSSFLTIGSGHGNEKETAVSMTQFAGGATLSKALPVYLEGGAAYMRYDPTFIASNGVQQRDIPTKWNTFSATGGIGWDFPITENLVFRPIFNFSLGQVASDLSLAARYIS